MGGAKGRGKISSIFPRYICECVCVRDIYVSVCVCVCAIYMSVCVCVCVCVCLSWAGKMICMHPQLLSYELSQLQAVVAYFEADLGYHKKSHRRNLGQHTVQYSTV